MYIYMYQYMYICVCVYVCVCMRMYAVKMCTPGQFPAMSLGERHPEGSKTQSRPLKFPDKFQHARDFAEGVWLREI